MTITVSPQEAEKQFFELPDSVLSGEGVIITETGSPIGGVASVAQVDARPTGIFAGKFSVPEDFNDPLQDGFSGFSK